MFIKLSNAKKQFNKLFFDMILKSGLLTTMKPKDEPPRRYGRQGEGKTIKSISLESDVALFAEMLAEESGLSLSAMINQILKQDADKKTASQDSDT